MSGSSRHVYLAWLLVCGSIPVLASAQAVQIVNGGIWTAIGDTTSSVKACGVKGDISGGIFLLYGRGDKPDTLRLTLRKTAWHIPGLTVPINVTFAGGPDFHFIGKGVGADIRTDIPAEDVRAFIHHFTADAEATLDLPNGREPSWHLDLQGTTPTIEGMARCLEAAQIWLPPPFSQPPTLAATPTPMPGPVQPAPDQGWINPDTLPPSSP